MIPAYMAMALCILYTIFFFASYPVRTAFLFYFCCYEIFTLDRYFYSSTEWIYFACKTMKEKWFVWLVNWVLLSRAELRRWNLALSRKCIEQRNWEFDANMGSSKRNTVLWMQDTNERRRWSNGGSSNDWTTPKHQRLRRMVTTIYSMKYYLLLREHFLFPAAKLRTLHCHQH